MTENDLLEGLRTASLPADDFHHCQHLHAGWLYLDRWKLSEAMGRFSADILALATTHGAPGMFHSTITWTFLFALDERRRQLGEAHSWDAFAASFPELFDWKAFLGRYYTDELLWSDRARQSFVLPDRLAVRDSGELEIPQTRDESRRRSRE